MSKSNGIHPDLNISDIPYPVLKKVCDGLDQNGKWREVIATVKHKIYRIENVEVEKIAQACYRHPSIGHSPSNDMWEKYGDLGMKVREMWCYLDKLKLEKELVLLKKPSELLVMVKEPEPQYTIFRKKALRIKCEAKGFPYPRYVWYHKALDSNNPVEVEENLTGILEIREVRRRHAGTYQCRIHNADTLKAMKKNRDLRNLMLMSRPCLVIVEGNANEDEEYQDERVPIPTGYVPDIGKNPTVYQRPGPMGPPQSSLRIVKQTIKDRKIVNMKDSLCLICQAAGNPPPTYQWICDDMVLQGETSTKLFIDMCWLSNAGTYWCIVSNGQQEILSKKITVQVIDPQLHPEDEVLCITEGPKHRRVHKYDSAQLFCKATTRQGIVQYTWYQTTADGKVNRVNSGQNGLLTLLNVTSKHAGMYYCEVRAIDENTGQEIDRKRTCDASIEVVESQLHRLPPIDKIALLIGMENAKAGIHLNAVPFDLQAAVVQFKSMNFKVISLLDLTLKELHQAIDLLCDFTEPRVYVVLYVVGHGFFYHGNHYLMPWDLPHGRRRVEDCLCLEEVHKKIQDKTPQFFVMINDICREDGKGKDVTNSSHTVPNFKTKVKGNSLIIYAASKAEQSYEPTPTDQHRVENRGAFNQHFCKALEKYKDKPVVEVFNHLQDYFCQHYEEIYGKRYPMHPEMVHNLMEWQRSLNDKISYEGMEIEAEKRHVKYAYINQLLRQPLKLQINHTGGLVVFTMECVEHFSNRFDLVFSIDQREPQNIEVNLELIVQPHPTPITKHVENNSVEWRFVFRDIQRLQHDFQPMLRIRVGSSNLTEINLMQQLGLKFICMKRPLISQCDVWQQEPKKEPHVKEPTEDECRSLEEESQA